MPRARGPRRSKGVRAEADVLKSLNHFELDRPADALQSADVDAAETVIKQSAPTQASKCKYAGREGRRARRGEAESRRPAGKPPPPLPEAIATSGPGPPAEAAEAPKDDATDSSTCAGGFGTDDTPPELTEDEAEDGEDVEAALPAPACYSSFAPWDEQRFALLKVLAPATRSGGQIELHLDILTGKPVAVKRVPHHRFRESSQAYHRAYPDELEDPWQELAVNEYLGGPGQYRVDGVCLYHGTFINSTGDAVIASEYLPGGDLFDYASQLGDPGPRREQQVWPLVRSLIHTILSVHSRGVAHGDVSLENTMRRGGCCPQVVLVDFGMAVTGDLAAAMGVRGKPSYQAPEMHTQKKYDARYCDLFACGVVAYALAIGGYPWNSTRPDECVAFTYAWRHGLPAFLQRRRVAVAGVRTSVEAVLSVRFQRLLSVLLDFEPERRMACASLCYDAPYDGPTGSLPEAVLGG